MHSLPSFEKTKLNMLQIRSVCIFLSLQNVYDMQVLISWSHIILISRCIFFVFKFLEHNCTNYYLLTMVCWLPLTSYIRYKSSRKTLWNQLKHFVSRYGSSQILLREVTNVKKRSCQVVFRTCSSKNPGINNWMDRMKGMDDAIKQRSFVLYKRFDVMLLLYIKYPCN